MIAGNRWVALLTLSTLSTGAAARRQALPLIPEPRLEIHTETVRERRWGLFAGGLVMFAAGWALDIGVSYGLNHPGAEWSLIPLVGPLVQMGDSWGTLPRLSSGNPQVDVPANQRIDEVNHTIQTGAYVILTVDFALQLTGLALVTAGVVGHRVQRSYAFDARGVLVRF
jgi:hypothetical protein